MCTLTTDDYLLSYESYSDINIVCVYAKEKETEQIW